MEKMTLSEIHNATLELLNQVDKICKSIGVEYFLAYGTLLGAIRHKNIIPWDDDADIWMKRDDYNRFFSYLKTKKEDLYPISYCSREETKNYSIAINRVTDLRYEYVDTVANLKLDYGVFIDVYPLDNACNDMQDYLKLYNKIEKLNNRYSIFLNGWSFSSKIKSVVKKSYNILLHLIYKNEKNLLRKVEINTQKLLNENTTDSDKYYGVVIWDAYRKIYLKNLFEGVVDVELGEYLFKAPQKYDELLKILYGDYMELPPEEKRVPYHGYEIYKK